jgi:hypothetical protein
VCEYDGLVFKQPREEQSAELAENVPVNHGASPRSAMAPHQQEQGCQRGSSGTPSRSAFGVTPAQQRGPADSLEARCASWFEAGAQECGSEEVAAALLDICQRLCAGNSLSACKAQLQGGAATPAVAAAATNEEVEQADYQVDLEARKAGLRARLASYEKVGGAPFVYLGHTPAGWGFGRRAKKRNNVACLVAAEKLTSRG